MLPKQCFERREEGTDILFVLMGGGGGAFFSFGSAFSGPRVIGALAAALHYFDVWGRTRRTERSRLEKKTERGRRKGNKMVEATLAWLVSIAILCSS